MSDNAEQGTYWAVITAPILEARTVSDGAKLFYCEVSRRTNRLGYCWASNKTLAEELSVGERTISRYVSELELAGFITTEQIGVSDRKRRHERRIRLAVPTPFNLAKNGEVNVAKNGELNIAKNGDHYKENNKSNKNTPSSPPQGDASVDFFERFWARYPKKKNKQAARKAWDKLNPNRELCKQMSVALIAQMRSEEWQRENGRFVPYPASWINGKRWEDEVTIPAPPRSEASPSREEDQWIT